MKSVRLELIGQRFGRLVAVSFAGRTKDRKALWLCRCDCGSLARTAGKYLRNGRTRSCGCLHSEQLRTRSVTHGMSNSSTYQCWQAMKNRCYNQKQKSYPRYGGIGIKVCPAWRDSFTAFLTEVGERQPGTTLDRKNPFGNYELGNARWATPSEQNRNTRGRFAIGLLNRLASGSLTVDQVLAAWSPAEAFESGYTRIP